MSLRRASLGASILGGVLLVAAATLLVTISLGEVGSTEATSDGEVVMTMRATASVMEDSPRLAFSWIAAAVAFAVVAALLIRFGGLVGAALVVGLMGLVVLAGILTIGIFLVPSATCFGVSALLITVDRLDRCPPRRVRSCGGAATRREAGEERGPGRGRWPTRGAGGPRSWPSGCHRTTSWSPRRSAHRARSAVSAARLTSHDPATRRSAWAALRWCRWRRRCGSSRIHPPAPVPGAPGPYRSYGRLAVWTARRWGRITHWNVNRVTKNPARVTAMAGRVRRSTVPARAPRARAKRA